MKIVPHLDIVDPERIEAILYDPENYAWRAIDSETLDTWTPDLGLTYYTNPSIYRPEGVARSGISSTLRHRFWQTVEHQADHTGLRYIGVVLYDRADEECPLEVRLAANDIGRIEPTRHDNRVHLIVIDKPIEFIGEMEVFQLTAPGPGQYRIEHFVLLKERPEPSSFKPIIERLSASVQPQGATYTGEIHFITSQTVICTVEANSSGQPPVKIATPEPTTLHTIRLPGLAPNCDYTVTVTATEKAGTQAKQQILLSTRPHSPSSEKAIAAPIELINLSQTNLAGLPLTFGLPLPKGALFDPAGCRVQLGQTEQPASVRVHARWPDQSARWALVDTVAASEWAKALPESGAGSLSGVIQFEPGIKPPPEGLICQADETGIRVTGKKLRVAIKAGPLAASLSIEQRIDSDDWRALIPVAADTGLDILAVLGNNLTLKSESIRDLALEEDGRHRAVVKFTVPHQDEHGLTHLQSTIRLTIYAGQLFVKLNHRLEVVSPLLAPAAGGDPPVAEPRTEAVQAAIVGSTGEAATLLTLNSLELRVPWPETQAIHRLGQPWAAPGSNWRLVHEHDLAYYIEEAGQPGEEIAGREAGHIALRGASGMLHLGIRNFWQTYPKGIRVTSQAVQLELFPSLSDKPFPGDEEAWHRLSFWLRDGKYLLKSGMALTSEVLLNFSEDDDQASAIMAWFEQPPVVRPEIDYLNDTGAINPLAPKIGSLFPKYEDLADRSIQSFQEDREHFRAYGHVNFGDWYGESGWSWGNNEYDPAYCAYAEFLRGGVAGWAIWGAESVRHLVDVDTLNFSTAADQIGGQAMHMPGHLGGYLPPRFRSKMAGTKSIPSHVWVEGPLLHYLLTGDETVRETVEKTKQWLLQDRWFDNYDFVNCRESGWHIIHLCMLASATNDPRCLNAAAIIVQRVLEKEQPGGGWVHMLMEPHCGCGYPRCRGEAGFMVGVLLSGLKRYYHLTEDERVARAIVGGARWLIDNTFDAHTNYFRYTSCKNRTLGGTYQLSQAVLEGLVDAYELSGDPEIGRYVRLSLSAIGLFPEDLGHLGLGKAMAQQMRYVPTLLAALQQRPLQEID